VAPGGILSHAAELRFSRAEPIIMGMPQTLDPIYWTADMVRALPADGNRYELVHGELLVTPAPRLLHQEVVFRLGIALRGYLDREPVGHAMLAPADISWDPGTLVQPDLFVAELGEIRTLDWGQVRHLLLAAEVLSPTTARFDRFTKRRRYQEAGVGTYWIVDPDARAVEVWTPADLFPMVERRQLRWQPAGASASFTLWLEELFRPI
jgi:Uma2 family endonuclease